MFVSVYALCAVYFVLFGYISCVELIYVCVFVFISVCNVVF